MLTCSTVAQNGDPLGRGAACVMSLRMIDDAATAPTTSRCSTSTPSTPISRGAKALEYLPLGPRPTTK
jgi:hypothetical protein